MSSNPTGRRQHLAAGVLLILLTALLGFLQLHVFPTLKLLAAGRGLPASPTSLWIVLRASGDPALWSPIAGIVLATLGLVWLQITRRGVSAALDRALATRRGALVAALAVAAVGARYLLDPGLPHQYDAKLHVMRVAEVARLIGAGEWPDWTFTYYGGYPLLRFAGPLYYGLAGAAAWAVGSTVAGIKIVLLLAHLGSSLAVWGLVREHGGSRRAAFLGAVGVAISFQHTSAVVLAGRQPVALLYVLFPLLLIAAERLARGVTLGRILGFGLASAGLVLAHPGLAPYGVLAGVAWTGIRVLTGARPGRRLAVTTGGLVAAGLLAGLVTAGLVIPALLERKDVWLSRMYGSASGFRIDWTPDLAQISRIARWSLLFGGSIAYIGLSLLVPFAYVCLRGRLDRGRRIALVGTALLLLFFVGGSYLPSRSVHYLVPVVALGAGLAVDALGPRAFPWLALALLVDLGPTTFQSPFRPDLDADVAYVRRAAEITGGRRCLRASLRDGVYRTSPWAAVYDTGLPLVTGPFREAASGEMYPWLKALLADLEEDLNAGRIRPSTVLALRVLGCEYILCEDGRRPVVPRLAGAGTRPFPLLPALRVEAAGPAIDVLDESEFAALREVRPRTWERALAVWPAGRPRAVTESWRLEPRRADLHFHAQRDGLLLVSLARLPGIETALDGRPVEHEPGPFGLLAVRVTAGRHRLEVEFEDCGYLLLTRVLSLAALALATLAGAFVLLRNLVLP